MLCFDKNKKLSPNILIPDDKPAALTVHDGKFHEFKKSIHNQLCRVEKLHTSFARSVKNEAV